jgi:gamma-glutamyltranspeptidase
MLAVAAMAFAATTAGSRPNPRQEAAPLVGAHDPAWAPDGAHVALSLRDQLWVVDANGGGARAVARWPARREAVERDPAWSPDGRTLAFAARLDETGFDLYLVDARGGAPRRVAALPGDQRWPSWTPDGRLVFASRAGGPWSLYVTSGPAGAPGPPPERLTDSLADDTEPRVSPDGRHLAFVSTRDAPDGESDLWLLELSGRVVLGAAGPRRPPAVPLLRERGAEWSPAWSPDGRRLAFGATRDGWGSIRIATVPVPGDADPAAGGAVTPPMVVSQRAGQVAWSPDGRTLLVTDLADHDDGYNGQPRRETYVAAASFPSAMDAGARFLDAPAPPDASVRPLRAVVAPTPARRLAMFDGVWEALARRYYAQEPSASAWRALRDRYRPRAAAAADEAALEDLTDALIADQPLVRAPVTSRGGLVVSAHPLASEAGARALRAGGNAVDAAIAASFALGVVEPDASGLGGDGMALVWLAGGQAPIVVDFKDQAPAAASLDNPAVFRDGHLADHGPAAVNTPGVVAGMDHLYRRFGSGRVAWAELLAPAIDHAERGFILDDALPATIAEARATLARYEASSAIFLPDGRVPRAGDRLVNRDLASTLRALAAGGADAFYRGDLARRMIDDLAIHGGVLSLEDLEQYRVIEREPVRGRYRDHVVFSTPPPVASGTAIVDVLQTLDRQPLAPGTRLAADPDAVHRLIETLRHAQTVRAADPALWQAGSAAHLDPAHARDVAARIDPARASSRRTASGDAGVSPAGGSAAEGDEDEDDEELEPASHRGRGTTALVAADREGNLVVVTQTLSSWGGSLYVSGGLGFLYNNHLRMARTRRGVPGQLTPRARSSSANASTIVCREVDGRLVPRLAAGAAGSAWIVPSVVSVVTAVVDGDLGAQAAVEAPRLRVDEAGQVQMEDRYPRRVVRELVRRGHVVARVGAKGELRYGFASAIVIGRDELSAGADPRRSHAAVAVP